MNKPAIRQWFSRSPSQIQATTAANKGTEAFRMAEIEFYQYELKLQPEIQYHAYILELNKKIKCPYYMGVNKDGKKSFPYIRFYDSKIAMMISLYGNVNEYLDSIKVIK